MSNRNAIMVEQAGLGSYLRFALTDQDFADEYEARLKEDMLPPNGIAQTYPLTPAISLWYMRVEVDSPVWRNFFTDMTLDLSDIDLANGIRAVVSEDDTSEELLEHLPPMSIHFQTTSFNLF